MSGVTTSPADRGFTVHPRSAFIRRGGTAVLRCTASPGFTVTGWLHDGQAVTATRRDHILLAAGMLTIKSFSRHGSTADTSASDEGSYQCVATGPQGAVVSRPARLLTAGITTLTLLFKLSNLLTPTFVFASPLQKQTWLKFETR